MGPFSQIQGALGSAGGVTQTVAVPSPRNYRAPPHKETGTTMADAVDATTMNNMATMAR